MIIKSGKPAKKRHNEDLRAPRRMRGSGSHVTPPVWMSMENQQESIQSAHLRNVLAATLQSALTAG